MVFGIWSWSLDLVFGFGFDVWTWIWSLDLELEFGVGIWSLEYKYLVEGLGFTAVVMTNFTTSMAILNLTLYLRWNLQKFYFRIFFAEFTTNILEMCINQTSVVLSLSSPV